MFLFVCCVLVFGLNVCICANYVQCPRRPEENTASPTTGVTEGVSEPNLSLTLRTLASATWKPRLIKSAGLGAGTQAQVL